jgi:hypothetical protein
MVNAAEQLEAETIPLENAETVEDVIALPDEPQKADSVRREEALTATVVQSYYSQGETPDLFKRFEENFDATYNSNASDLVGEAKTQALSESSDIALEVALDDPELGASFLQKRVEEMNHDSAASQLLIDSLSSIDDEISQSQASNHYVQAKLHKLVSDLKGGDKFWDYAGELLAINSYIDRNDLIELFGIDEVESTKELASRLAQLSPVERATLYAPLEAAVLEATDGNQVRTAKFLSELYGFDPDSTTSEAVWSAVDVAAFTPYGWIKNLVRGVRKGSTAKTIAAVNPEAGANLIVASGNSEKVAAATGVSKTNAAESVSPFPYSEVSIGSVDGIEDSIVVAVKEQQRIVSEALETESTLLAKESVLSKEEKVAAQAKQIDYMQSKQFEKDHGYSATNAQVIRTNDDEFIVRFEGVNSAGVKVKADLEVPYTRNDVGSFSPDVEFTGLRSGFLSPSSWANKFQKGIVEKATTLGFKEEASLQRYLKIGQDILKPLNKKSVDRVDHVLMKGDEFMVNGENVGKTFSLKELMYDGIDGIRLTIEETKAYFGMRQMWDHIHNAMEQATIKQWKFDGVKSVGKFGDDLQYGKVLKPTETLPTNVRQVMDLRTRTAQAVDDLADDLKNAKIEIVKLRRSIAVKDNIFEYAAITKGSARNLPRSGVLPYRAGYVPRVRENANYVVHTESDKVINGTKGKMAQAVGLFTSKKEAQAFALKEEARTGVKHKASYDREIDPEIRSDLLSIQMGRPYTGQRVKDRSITQGKGVDRISSLEALDRNLAAMTNMVNMNEFRMGQLQRWHNTARSYLADPSNIRSEFIKGLDNSKVNALSSMRTWLDDQFRIPTKAEQQWEGTVRQLAEWMEGSNFFLKGKGSSARLWLAREGGKDITARMRGAAFHALLGWYNPAQLFIQASGATVAFSMNPAKFPKIMMQYKAIRANIFHGDDVAKETAKRLGFNEGEYLDTLNGIRKSGIMESVKTNADYQAARLGYSITKDSVGKVIDNGLMFFREGEMFSRGYSWLLAADDYRKATKVKKLTDKDIDNITSKMAQYTLNLNRSNRASWQKGWLSIPTQFWQVTTKFTETMLGTNKALTRYQRTKMAAGQMALFGATGIPAGNWLLNNFYEFTGQDYGNLSENEVIALRGGITALAFKGLTGEDIDISSRVSLPSGYDMMVDTVTADKSATELFAGAFGALPNRVYAAVANSAPRLRDMEFSKEELFEIGSEFASIISTFRNAEKAYMMAKLGKITTSDGKTLDVVDWGEDWRMILAQGSGFAPMKVRDYYQIEKSQQAMNNYRNNVVKQVMHHWNKYVVSGKIMTPDGRDRWDRIQSAMLSSLPEAEQIKAMESINKRLRDDKLYYIESFNKGVEQVLSGQKAGTLTTRMPFSVQNYNEGE